MNKSKVFSLCLLGILVLGGFFFCIPVMRADTATVDVGCWYKPDCWGADCGVSTTCPAICGYDGSGCYNGLDNGSDCMFTDPIPAGNFMSSVDVQVNGGNGNPDCPYPGVNVTVNGSSVISYQKFNSTGWCADPHPPITAALNNPIAGYNYGGQNTLHLSLQGGVACVSDVVLTFHYSQCTANDVSKCGPAGKECQVNNGVTQVNSYKWVCNVPAGQTTGTCQKQSTDLEDCMPGWANGAKTQIVVNNNNQFNGHATYDVEADWADRKCVDAAAAAGMCLGADGSVSAGNCAVVGAGQPGAGGGAVCNQNDPMKVLGNCHGAEKGQCIGNGVTTKKVMGIAGLDPNNLPATGVCKTTTSTKKCTCKPAGAGCGTTVDPFSGMQVGAITNFQWCDQCNQQTGVCGNPVLQQLPGISCGPPQHVCIPGILFDTCVDLGGTCDRIIPGTGLTQPWQGLCMPVCHYQTYPMSPTSDSGGGGCAPDGATNNCGNGTSQTCSNGLWGPCVPACPAGQTNPYTVCNADGTTSTFNTCGTTVPGSHQECQPDATCKTINTCGVSDDCTKCGCNPNDKQNCPCGGQQTCQSDGTWSPCPNKHLDCVNESVGKICECVDGTGDDKCKTPGAQCACCTPGDTTDCMCGGQKTCTVDASGNASWTACASHTDSQGGVCKCDSTPGSDQCILGDSTSCPLAGTTQNCPAGGVETCQMDSGGVLGWSGCPAPVCPSYIGGETRVCPCGGQQTQNADYTWTDCPDKHTDCLNGICQCVDGSGQNACTTVGAACASECGCDDFGNPVCNTFQTGESCSDASTCPTCLNTLTKCGCDDFGNKTCDTNGSGETCSTVSDCSYLNCPNASKCGCDNFGNKVCNTNESGETCSTVSDCSYLNCPNTSKCGCDDFGNKTCDTNGSGETCSTVSDCSYLNCPNASKCGCDDFGNPVCNTSQTGESCSDASACPTCPTATKCGCDANGNKICNALQIGADCTDASTCSDCSPNQPPSAYLIPSSGDYCSYPLSGIPASGWATFQWNYSDPENDPEASWQMQISTDSSFDDNDIVFDSGAISGDANIVQLPVLLASTNPTSTCMLYPNKCSYINYGVGYYWRVKVWDGVSTDEPLWNVYADTHSISPLNNYNPNGYPTYADDKDGNVNTFTVVWPHPAPWILYSAPATVSPGDTVNFTDSSTCYNNDGSTYSCNTVTSNTYAWSFGNGSAIDPTQGSTSNIYALPGTYKTKLTICDSIGCCSGTLPVKVSTTKASQIPQWSEVTPFQ